MTKKKWKEIGIKVLKTWCQAFVGVIGIDSTGRSMAEVDWVFALSAATLAAIVCFFWNLSLSLPDPKSTDDQDDMYSDEENDEQMEKEE